MKKILEFLLSLFRKQKETGPEDKKPEETSDQIDLVAENHCEILICKKCGQEYYSSGKYDPGICKSCIALENFIGGPLGK